MPDSSMQSASILNIIIINNKCIKSSRKIFSKVHGGWSEWSEWTKCSVLCGFGTKKRYRKCNNPTPKYGGDACTGSNTKEIACQGNQCSEWFVIFFLLYKYKFQKP